MNSHRAPTDPNQPAKKKPGCLKLALIGLGLIVGLFVLAGVIGALTSDPEPQTQPTATQTATQTPSPEPDPTPEPEPTVVVPEPTVVATDPSLPPAVAEQLYVEFVRGQHAAELEGVPDSMLVELGRSFCMAYDGGATAEDVSMLILNNATTEGQALAFATAHGAAVASFCPEHGDKIGE